MVESMAKETINGPTESPTTANGKMGSNMALVLGEELKETTIFENGKMETLMASGSTFGSTEIDTKENL